MSVLNSSFFREVRNEDYKFGQATKSIWWMPWRRTAKKDVIGCEKLRGVAKYTLIRRCPNGATYLAARQDVRRLNT